jgi:1-acyl-sn-glycerol-3-phosphate acyltransferase
LACPIRLATISILPDRQPDLRAMPSVLPMNAARLQPFAKRLTYDVARVAARLFSVVTCRIRCEGRPHVPMRGGALICANHQSYLDPILVGLACDRRLNYLARQSLFRFVPFRWLIDWFDAIPIEREGMGLAGLKETLRRLWRGEMVLIFPEGTRTHDGTIGPLKPGFTALARRGRVPLVPVAIVGAFQAWPRTQACPMPQPIWIQFGPSISPAEVAAMTDEQLLRRLHDALVRCQAAAGYSYRGPPPKCLHASLAAGELPRTVEHRIKNSARAVSPAPSDRSHL